MGNVRQIDFVNDSEQSILLALCDVQIPKEKTFAINRLISNRKCNDWVLMNIKSVEFTDSKMISFLTLAVSTKSDIERDIFDIIVESYDVKTIILPVIANTLSSLDNFRDIDYMYDYVDDIVLYKNNAILNIAYNLENGYHLEILERFPSSVVYMYRHPDAKYNKFLDGYDIEELRERRPDAFL